MFLFLVVLFPVLCADFYIREHNKKYKIVFFTGFSAAVLVCVYRALFSTRFIHHWAGFFSNFYFFFFRLTFPVVLICVLLACFFSRGKIDRGIVCFSPLAFSFSTVYLPVRIIGDAVVFTFFELFVVPVLQATMILAFTPAVSGFAAALVRKKKRSAAAYVLFLCIILCGPAAIETVWYTGMQFYVWIPLAALFSTGSILYHMKPETAHFFLSSLLCRLHR